ncbi:YolD-like family protein [Paenibacillus naphthalenovorans]|uniref:YolD-like family protein n=1 Tax=Paenibacillus naphthalenovorans TaxID=162209 RepID=UPI003D2B8215
MIKPNKLTPGKNLLWESMRIILPEHREALHQHKIKSSQRKRPALDDQEIDIITRNISGSFLEQCVISVELFDEFKEIVITGVVTKIDQPLKRIKMDYREDSNWVKYNAPIG